MGFERCVLPSSFCDEDLGVVPYCSEGGNKRNRERGGSQERDAARTRMEIFFAFAEDVAAQIPARRIDRAFKVGVEV